MAKEPTPDQAQKRVEDARAELEEAQQNLSVQVARGGMAHLVCEVLPGSSINHLGEVLTEGDQFHVEGLTAVGLATSFPPHIKIVGTHDKDLPSEEERRALTIKREHDHLKARLAEHAKLLKGKT